MSGRAFSHPDFGKEARVETCGCEVRLIFVANTEAQANDLTEQILKQLKQGGFHLTMMGKPKRVIEEGVSQTQKS